MANEMFARVKMEPFLRDADWSLTDDRSARFEWPVHIPADIRIAGGKRPNQMVWIEMACRRIVSNRRNLLVEMASHHP
jgi:type I site-specific restriction endonuclease